MASAEEIADARAQRLPESVRQVFEAFKNLGMSAPAALAATAGRDGVLPSTDPADGLIESFERGYRHRGAAPDEARRMAEAAVRGRGSGGRGSLSETRAASDAKAFDAALEKAARAADLRESALTATRSGSVALRETGARLGEQTSQASRRQITIIEAGWGSSGYYSRALLERDGPRVFAPGTQMFLDHPSRSEEVDRPERSVRDLAARIASTPRMVGNDLVAEAEVYEVWRPVIDSLASDIGLSIRALGETEMGEADGRRGPIVTALTEAISVDFVTKAGAGGKVGPLIESARASSSSYDEGTRERIRECRARLVRNSTHRHEDMGLTPSAAAARAESLWADDKHVLEVLGVLG